MKTNRKTRPQPSLASLTTDEYHQLADLVRTRTYGDILQQINKPRAEGGFDLDISIKPLQVLHRRVTELDRVNKLIADGQKLTLTAYDELQAGQTPPSDQIHNAILNATWLQVQYSENNPHQLLALQRLADFSARSEIRENRERIYQEKHTHKIDMDTFHKEHATARLEIQKRYLQLAEKRAEKELNTQNSSRERGGDHLGPFAKNWEDVRERARNAFGITPEESARRAELRRTWVDPSAHLNEPTPADTNAASADLTPTTLLDPDNPVHPVENPSSALSTLNSQRSTPSQTLEERVDHYNNLRAREFLAFDQQRSRRGKYEPFLSYVTQYRHCPCGNACPCPIHEDEEKFGQYFTFFWSLSPFHSVYANTLRARGLPYNKPKEDFP